MTNEQALELIGTLSKASIRVWMLTNTPAAGSLDKAVRDELKAAMRIAKALGVRVDEEELLRALES